MSATAHGPPPREMSVDSQALVVASIFTTARIIFQGQTRPALLPQTIPQLLWHLTETVLHLTLALPPTILAARSGSALRAPQPHRAAQSHLTSSSQPHTGSYNLTNLDYGNELNGGAYSQDFYSGNMHMSNRATVAPYQRMTPTISHHRPAMLTTSPVELSLPSHQETELWLRNHLKIPPPQPLNLSCLRDLQSANKLPNLTEMIFLAIWGSPYKRLGLSEIYTAIEDRYPELRTYEDKAWQRSIRHRLSLKACFVRVRRDRRGADWMIDMSKGLENGRNYRTPPPQHGGGSPYDPQNQSEEEITSAFRRYSSDSDAFLTPPPEMSSVLQDYTFRMASGSSLHDVTPPNMGNGYGHMPY